MSSPVAPALLPLAAPAPVGPPSALHVPALRDDSGGQVVVTRWGRVQGHTLRAGDRLVIGSEQEGGLVLLRPRGFGWPMLGRRSRAGLVAEPGGVPASALRWQVVGGLLGVLRGVDAAVLDPGAWWLEVRVRAAEGGAWRRAAAGLAGAPGEGPCSAEQAQQVCRRAAALRSSAAVEIAVLAARDPRRLEALQAGARPGAVVLDLHGPSPAGELVEGPWAPRVEGAQLSLFGAASAGRRAG